MVLIDKKLEKLKNTSTLILLKLLCSNDKRELFKLALYAKQAFIERMYYFHMINNSKVHS